MNCVCVREPREVAGAVATLRPAVIHRIEASNSIYINIYKPYIPVVNGGSGSEWGIHVP